MAFKKELTMKCKIESCNNHAEERALEPSDEQKWYLNAETNHYCICNECEDKGWKYNTVSDEYYFRPAHRSKVILNLKESKMDNKDDSVPCFDSKGNESVMDSGSHLMDTDFVFVRCMTCKNITSFKSSSASQRQILRDRCEMCTTVYPGQVLSYYNWWGDGSPIGHGKEMTPEQRKYITKTEFDNDMKKLEEDGVLEIVEMPPRDFEYDEYGRKFSRIKRSFGCKKCSDNCYNACKTLRDAGYKIEIKRTKTTMIEFKRVRDVTVEEHGINKPYKGVYACVVCGHEEIMDNSLEES